MNEVEVVETPWTQMTEGDTYPGHWIRIAACGCKQFADGPHGKSTIPDDLPDSLFCSLMPRSTPSDKPRRVGPSDRRYPMTWVQQGSTTWDHHEWHTCAQFERQRRRLGSDRFVHLWPPTEFLLERANEWDGYSNREAVFASDRRERRDVEEGQ